jgi:hypothetical protein
LHSPSYQASTPAELDEIATWVHDHYHSFLPAGYTLDMEIMPDWSVKVTAAFKPDPRAAGYLQFELVTRARSAEAFMVVINHGFDSLVKVLIANGIDHPALKFIQADR